MRVLETGNKVRQRLPEFVHVFRGLGKVVGKIDFGVAEFSQLVNRELEALLVFINQALDLEEVILLEGLQHVLHVVPHLGFELPAAIAKCQRQIRFASLLGLDLFGYHDESRGDDLVLVAHAVADVEVLHGMWQV